MRMNEGKGPSIFQEMYEGDHEMDGLFFPVAAKMWLQSRKPYLSENTARDYIIYVRTLSKFFGETYLTEITPDQLRSYQKMRMEHAGASSINKETCVLIQMLKRVGRWAAIAAGFQRLPDSKEEVGRCITVEEEERFFRVAFSRPYWEVAALVSLISINTSAGPGELTHVRLRDVDLVNRMTVRINAEGAKNEGRIRVLPLNGRALEAAKALCARAAACGATLPEHYLVPFSVTRNEWDPTRPQKHYYKAFKSILEVANLSFRPYDLRHTAITRLLENPDISEETVEAIAGHITHKMKKRYSHIRYETKRLALFSLVPNKTPTKDREERGNKPPAEILTNADVAEMLNDLGWEIAVAKIQASKCRFDTSQQTLKDMKANGVPAAVIVAMVKAK